MSNDQEKYFKFREELKGLTKIMGMASDTVLDQEISSYPIFVVHQKETIGVGIELVRREERKGKWSVNLSTLEEFVAKQLIESARVDHFRQVFKKPTEHLCLFAIDEIGATFVFIPRN